MSEYIIAHCVDSVSGVRYDERREEIVRCRDCKHYNEKTYEWVNGWTRTYTTCSMFDGCMVEPDGYCKWGERRDA